jgi:hypothetical protein
VKTRREPWSVCERKKAKTRIPTTIHQRTFVLGKVWEKTKYRFLVGLGICWSQKNCVGDALSACACIGLTYCQYLTDFGVFKSSSMPNSQKTPRSHYKYKFILLTHIITHDSESYETHLTLGKSELLLPVSNKASLMYIK